jgi:hypothetical protein
MMENRGFREINVQPGPVVAIHISLNFISKAELFDQREINRGLL